MPSNAYSSVASGSVCNDRGISQGQTDECGWRKLNLIFPKILGNDAIAVQDYWVQKKLRQVDERTVFQMVVDLGSSEKGCRYLR